MEPVELSNPWDCLLLGSFVASEAAALKRKRTPLLADAELAVLVVAQMGGVASEVPSCAAGPRASSAVVAAMHGAKVQLLPGEGEGHV